MILQCTFMLESPRVLPISTVRSLDNFAVIKTQIVASQKLSISNFRGIKQNVVATSSCQFVEFINSEDNSTMSGHYLAYLKRFTDVIKINDSNNQHYSGSIIESKQFMSITHALLYMSTSCLESVNELLQDYVLHFSLQGIVQDIILRYSEPTSTFISRKSIDLCIS